MRFAVLAARVLLGLPFAFFGLNTLLWSVLDRPILEPPSDIPARARDFYEALDAAGFMHPLRGAVEFVGGLSVLSGRFTPLGLVLLAPVLVHVVLFHLFLDPRGTVIAWILLALEAVLVVVHRAAFRGLVRPSTPRGF
ncbi:MAG: DoxX family membrane protein [Planctomycetota bacterium]